MSRFRKLFTGATFVLMLAPVPSHAWFFFFIPGSLFTSSDKKDVAEFHKKMDWAGLRDFAQKKIDADPTNADWWIQKSSANLKLRNFTEAENGYKEAIRLQPSAFIAANDLGVVYQNQGKFREALDQYLAALKIKPDYSLSMANAAAIQYRFGRPDLTWDIYQELLPIDPARAKTIKDRFLITDIRPVAAPPKTEAATINTNSVVTAPATASPPRWRDGAGG